MRSFAEASARRLPVAAPQNISNTLWAFARFGFVPCQSYVDTLGARAFLSLSGFVRRGRVGSPLTALSVTLL